MKENTAMKRQHYSYLGLSVHDYSYLGPSVMFDPNNRRENQRQYELRADTVSECKSWIDAIKLARSVEVSASHLIIIRN